MTMWPIIENLFTRSIAVVSFGYLAMWTFGWLDNYPPAYHGVKGHLQHAPAIVKAVALVLVFPVAIILWAIALYGPPWR